MGRPINYKKQDVDTSVETSKALWFMAVFSGETVPETATLVKQLGTNTVRLRSVATGVVEDFTLVDDANEPGEAHLTVYNGGSALGQAVKLMQHRVNVLVNDEVVQYRHNLSGVENFDDPEYVYFDVLVGPSAPADSDWTLDFIDPEVAIEMLAFTGTGSLDVSAIQYSIDGADPEQTSGTIVGVYNIIDTPDVGTYSVRIRYVTNIGTSEWSDPKTVEVG